MIPTQLTTVVLDLYLITLDMDNSEIHLVFRHETLTCMVSYQYKVSNLNVWPSDGPLTFNNSFSDHPQVENLCLKIFDINSRSRIKSSVPMYLRLGLVSHDKFVNASLPKHDEKQGLF